MEKIKQEIKEQRKRKKRTRLDRRSSDPLTSTSPACESYQELQPA